ncbi:MAG: glycosyltransferase family 2 protein [Clostridia bacterium]|nr:glycosyltransferase family 2 protein [Clostridia bacterium]
MYSIIVPIYKVEKYLPRCIESVLAQTYKDFELILVDDGSPDGCSSICEQYKKRDSRIKTIHKENGGLVSARKAGLEIASGDYICFVDGDDFISCDMLENYENTLNSNKVDVICTGYSRYFNEDKIVSMPQKIKNGFYNKNDLQTQIYHRMLSVKPFYNFYIFPSVCSKCFRKQIADLVYRDIPNNISLGEDVAATYAILLKANSISVIDYCGYMYRQNPDSMTHTYDKNLHEKIRNLIVYLKNIEASTDWAVGNQINEYIIFLLFLAKDNEFWYNQDGSYHDKKMHMKKYLNDPLFKKALKNVKIEGWKNKFILYCFKTGFLLPINMYQAISQRRRNNE